MTVPPDGSSAWLFIGTNTTLRDLTVALDLGSVPSSAITYNNTEFGWRIPAEQYGSPRLASILLCKPKFTVVTTSVTFNRSTNSLSISSNDTLKSIGNISPEFAAFILTDCIRLATWTRDSIAAMTEMMWVNQVAEQLFLTRPVITNGTEPTGTLYTIRDTKDISASMGAYVTSAAKAYSDGSRSDGSNPDEGLQTITVSAVVHVQKLALVGSKALTAIAGVLALVILLMAASQLVMPIREPFNLASITKAVKTGGEVARYARSSATQQWYELTGMSCLVVPGLDTMLTKRNSYTLIQAAKLEGVFLCIACFPLSIPADSWAVFITC